MKKMIFVLFFFSIMALIIAGCKKDDSSPTETPVDNSKELYPLAIGSSLEYNEYAIDQSNNKVAGSDLNATRTVMALTTKKGISCYLVIDNTYSGTTLKDKDTSYIYKDTSGNVSFFITISQEPIPGTKFELADWFVFFKPSAGTNKEYTVFKKDTTVKINYAGMNMDVPVTLNVVGKITGQEQVTVPYSTSPLTATRVDINMTVSAPSLNMVLINNQLFFQQWLTEGIGPIKESMPASSTENGYVRLLSKK
jgi:hypothetical protein